MVRLRAGPARSRVALPDSRTLPVITFALLPSVARPPVKAKVPTLRTEVPAAGGVGSVGVAVCVPTRRKPLLVSVPVVVSVPPSTSMPPPLVSVPSDTELP